MVRILLSLIAVLQFPAVIWWQHSPWMAGLGFELHIDLFLIFILVVLKQS